MMGKNKHEGRTRSPLRAENPLSHVRKTRAARERDIHGGRNYIEYFQLFFGGGGKFLGTLLVGVALGVFIRGWFAEDGLSDHDTDKEVLEKNVAVPNLFSPVREAPEKFGRDTYLPDKKETTASVAIADVDFSAGRDLVYVEDERVWWESDNDDKDNDDECDHSMHAAMEIPFRRLSNLVASTGKWQLRVQEAYRENGVHASKSLHKQGRAIDLTVDNLHGEKLTPFEKIAAYAELAKLAWQAGFDWVYYEYANGTGPHIHASVRPDGKRITNEMRAAIKDEADAWRTVAQNTAAAED